MESADGRFRYILYCWNRIFALFCLEKTGENLSFFIFMRQVVTKIAILFKKIKKR